MAHTYEELKHMTVVQLRDIAKGVQHDAVKGYSQLNKEHLLVALCTALGIEAHAHHAHVGAEKVRLKARIRDLKAQSVKAIAAHRRRAAQVGAPRDPQFEAGDQQDLRLGRLKSRAALRSKASRRFTIPARARRASCVARAGSRLP
jgi:hypothetical protein